MSAADRQMVWVLTITHRHGDDTTVHASEEGARAVLAEYCREWWNEAVFSEEGDVTQPDGDDDVIAAYFDFQSQRAEPESYELSLVEVQP